MKAEQLMIGDWVVYEGDTEYSDPVKIEGMDIATDSLITSDREDVGFDGVWPIPLTPEILEKNGLDFSRFKCDYFPEDKNYTLEICYDGNGTYWTINCDEYSIIELKYVHELQHAIRLCGIEKEIEL